MFNFADWLDLDLSVVTWDGKHTNEFTLFWDKVFSKDIGFTEHLEELDLLIQTFDDGQIKNWLSWLKSEYLIYIFLYKNIKMIDLLGFIDLQNFLYIFRNFFSKKCNNVSVVDDYFNISHLEDEKLSLSFSDFKKKIHLKNIDSNRNSLKSFEITLCEQWEQLLNIVTNNYRNEKYIKVSTLEINTKRILLNVAVLGITLTLFIFGIKKTTNWYDDYLAKQITIFEPYFFWLDKEVSFKQSSSDKIKIKKISLKSEFIDEEKILNVPSELERFSDESEIIVSSLNSGVKDIALAISEDSKFEEIKKGGFRNYRYGRNKAYRVLINSISSSMTRRKILKILKDVNAVKAGKVEPGKEIPGGVYFNVYIDSSYLNKFFDSIKSFSDLNIYESKTVFSTPKNQSKVFIWVKSI
ncbi:MAG: hypothetical protein N4A33_10110 [Bacteriovoracaceae bacterium]|jgi:hypothetical protein|nr:hypothetical protein [Bacteriovoracaceae bacterium]